MAQYLGGGAGGYRVPRGRRTVGARKAWSRNARNIDATYIQETNERFRSASKGVRRRSGRRGVV